MLQTIPNQSAPPTFSSEIYSRFRPYLWNIFMCFPSQIPHLLSSSRIDYVLSEISSGRCNSQRHQGSGSWLQADGQTIVIFLSSLLSHTQSFYFCLFLLKSRYWAYWYTFGTQLMPSFKLKLHLAPDQLSTNGWYWRYGLKLGFSFRVLTDIKVLQRVQVLDWNEVYYSYQVVCHDNSIIRHRNAYKACSICHIVIGGGRWFDWVSGRLLQGPGPSHPLVDMSYNAQWAFATFGDNVRWQLATFRGNRSVSFD